MRSFEKSPILSGMTGLFLVALMLLAFLPKHSCAQWNVNTSVNLLISSLPVADMETASTSDGKTWIAFYVENAGNYDMRAQLIDANGYKLLGTDGLLVSNQISGSATFVFNVCVDASNNLIIAHQDMRTGSMSAVVYKISETGTQLWGSTGIVLGGGLAPYPAALSNGEVVVAWSGDAGNTINLQKITTSGTLAWTTPITVLVGSSTTTRGQLIGNLAGKFTLVMQKNGSGISTTLYSAMYDNTGTALYTPVQICNETTSAARYYSIAAQADTTYFGYYSSVGFRFNSYLQRINPGGSLPWGINGSHFNTATGSNDSYQMTTNINQTPSSPYVWSVCTFSDPNQTVYGVYIQKFLKTSGARQFTDGAKVVYAISANTDQQAGGLALVNDNPMFMSYDVTEKIYATRLDASGNFVWPGSRVELSSTTASAGSPKMRYGFTPDGPNRCAGIWTEDRGSGYHGYAQGISVGGLIGLVVATQGGVPAVITTSGGTLQMVATVYPSTANQAVNWSIVPGTGAATISTSGLVTGVTNGTVWAKANAVQDLTMKDSLMITISGQIVLAPTVITQPATSVQGTTATLNGSVNANGGPTTVTFNWGTSVSYGNTVSATPGTVTGGTPTPVLANLTGLQPMTTYHFRCAGVNSAGPTNGSDLTFTTCQPPAAAGTITGPTSVCQNQNGVVYSVSAIQYATSYTWTVPTGATIVGGAGTTSITVNFSASATSGPVTVAGTNTCQSGTSSSLAVTVNPTPVPTITGPTETCAGASPSTYTTESGMSNYTWIVSAGGSIVAGTGTNSVQVQWNTTGTQTLSVNYNTAAGCPALNPTSLTISVEALPAAAGTISGDTSVCQSSQGHIYTVQPITGAVTYMWTVPAGATIASGAGSISITVDFSASAASGVISVLGNNICGNGAGSSMNVAVHTAPAAPVVDSNGVILTSSATTGNQWYKDGTMIPGATGQQYVVSETGTYWTVVTVNGCSSPESNHIYILITGMGSISGPGFNIHPVPNNGHFTITFHAAAGNSCDLEIYNVLGTMVFRLNNININGTVSRDIDLGAVPGGVYMAVVKDRESRVVKQFVIR
jgi:hypothetical protein